MTEIDVDIPNFVQKILDKKEKGFELTKTDIFHLENFEADVDFVMSDRIRTPNPIEF